MTKNVNNDVTMNSLYLSFSFPFPISPLALFFTLFNLPGPKRGPRRGVGSRVVNKKTSTYEYWLLRSGVQKKIFLVCK